MNIFRFHDTKQDGFELLDLQAKFDFKTETSISFLLGRGKSSQTLFRVFGWLDVHHPVKKYFGEKAYLRIALPAAYQNFENLKKIVATVFEVLEIPEDIVYEAAFFTPGNQSSLISDEPGAL